jgi:putative nucleotidyltransferase with HDIG domain
LISRYDNYPFYPDNNKFKELKSDLATLDFLLNKLAHIDAELDFDKKRYYISYISLRLYVNARELNDPNEINLYLDIAKNILESADVKDADENEKLLINNLGRNYCALYYFANFEPSPGCFSYCSKYLRDDLNYSKSQNMHNYITALTKYLCFCIDYIKDDIYRGSVIVNLEEFASYREDFVNTLIKYFQHKEAKKEILLRSALFFLNETALDIARDIKKNGAFDKALKTRIFVLTICMVKLLNKEEFDYRALFNVEHAYYKEESSSIIKNLSKYLSLLLCSQAEGAEEILRSVMAIYSNFKEYSKLMNHFYARALYLDANRYRCRRRITLSRINFVKSIKDIIPYKNEIVKLRKDIERYPIKALINYYNIELSRSDISQDAKNVFKINPLIIDINSYILKVKRIISDEIAEFKKNLEVTKQYETKSDYLKFFENEMSNVIKFASDTYLLQDLGKIYGDILDSYIKREELDYREDYTIKASKIKMAVVDVNPYFFALALLFSKLGKMRLIMDTDEIFKLGLKKKTLTESEKERIGKFFEYSIKYLNKCKDDTTVNWRQIGDIISNVRSPAESANGSAPIESRLIKIISAIINKITRQDADIVKLFNFLYDEAYLHAKREWSLDPILIYYLNRYMSKKGKISLKFELTGEKIEFAILRQTNSLILENIYQYARYILDKRSSEDTDVMAQMEELKEMNSESLIDAKGVRKNIAYLDVMKFLKSDKSVYYETKYLEYPDKIYIFDILANYLTAMGKTNLITTFKFVITQLMNNANKSNLKRIYFKQKNMDINQKYLIGIKDFMEYSAANQDKMLEDLRQEDFKIKIGFQSFNNTLVLSISNNFKIHGEEIRLINEAIYNSKRLGNLKDAYKRPVKSMEGDGLGIIMTFLFFRKIGLPRENFKMNVKENETVIKITVPFSFVSKEEEQTIAEEIAKEIDTIPMIPENINRLRRLLNDKEAKIEDIEKEVLMDPSLTADVLKMANSAYYTRLNAVRNIRDAIQILGTTAISNFILLSSSLRLLKDKVTQDRIEEIMKHSETAAFYANDLMRYKKLNLNVDDIYLATLLHDIGKIVVEGINPDIYKRIQQTMENKDLPIEVIEDIAGGLSHSLTGALLAKKWNFPDIVYEVIKCHHNPRTAENNPDAVFVVYLANAMTYFNKEKILFENIDMNVLEFLELNDKEKFNKLAVSLMESYNQKRK